MCLAAIMAQAGAWVPAARLELTPVDKVFVRMGAHDHIFTGQVPRPVGPRRAARGRR